MQSKSEGDQYRSTTTIDDLPDDVLKLIFKQTNFKCALLCGRVCRRFLEVSNKNIDFMRTVKIQIALHNYLTVPKDEMIRTYQIISIKEVVFDTFDMVANWKRFLANCEELEFVRCKFQSIDLVAALISSCRILKDLKIDRPELHDYGVRELDVAVNANNSAIQLELVLYGITAWVVLKLFPIHQIQLSRLCIQIVSRVTLSDVADMMAFIHQNYNSVFRELVFEIADNSLPLTALFISQIKQLTSLTLVRRLTKQVFDQICNNMTELQKLSIIVDDDLNELNNLKSLTKLKSLEVRLCCGYGSSLTTLSIYKLQLEKLKICHETRFDNGTIKLEFLVSTPAQQLTSLKELTLDGIQITRNLLQHIFTKMPNLEILNVYNSNTTSRTKLLTYEKNSINKLKNLQSLTIDSFWIDESFLCKIKLPKLEKFILMLSYTYPFKECCRILAKRLYMRCPKLNRIQFMHYLSNGSDMEEDDCSWNINEEDSESSNSDHSDYSDEDTDDEEEIDMDDEISEEADETSSEDWNDDLPEGWDDGELSF